MDQASKPVWTFLTNHGHVFLLIARWPDIRLTQIADAVGIGERAAHRIVDDLVHEGYVDRQKVGRRSIYAVDLDRPFRHPLEAHHTLRAIEHLATPPAAPQPPTEATRTVRSTRSARPPRRPTPD